VLKIPDLPGAVSMAQILDGKKVAQEVIEKVAAEVEYLGVSPKLAIVLVGSDPASLVYVKLKGNASQRAKIGAKTYFLKESTSEKELISVIKKLNSGKDNGILVQLPLPKHLNEEKILLEINKKKDVDGLHPENIGNMLLGNAALLPCTPAGIIELLDYYKIPIQGKHAVVVGRSNIVGKPIAMLLLSRNATVTVCHSKTKDLASHTKQADILVAAAGRPNMITGEMIKQGAVVIDVGTNKINGKLVGDVEFSSACKKACCITPVPGGVGPLTVALLLKNTLSACKMQKKK
jgi:methylenetetrahydrofolate dehydrogenase (NADP+) / methenyltetrahydrofolate cyclohydrolase